MSTILDSIFIECKGKEKEPYPSRWISPEELGLVAVVAPSWDSGKKGTSGWPWPAATVSLPTKLSLLKCLSLSILCRNPFLVK